MQEMIQSILRSIGEYLPNLLGALAILIIGWLVAYVIAAIIRAVLRKTTIDNKLAKMVFGADSSQTMPVEDIVAKSVFYLIMLFVLVAFFQALKLTVLTEPLNNLLNSVFEYLPRLVGAGVLLLIAWVIATVLRRVLQSVFKSSKLDERLGGEGAAGKEKPTSLSKTFADIVYWLIFLLFLPGILNALGLEGPLEPVKKLLNRVSEFMPNIIGAALIVLVGWFVARLVQRIVSSLLAAAGADKLGEKIGMSGVAGGTSLSKLVGLILYVFILIPVIIAGLNALQLDAITQPASAMLSKIMDALPAIFSAVLILVISFVIARIVSGLITNLLAGVGFNKVLVSLGITKKQLDGAQAPSAIVGKLVLVTIMIMASIEAARMLQFAMFADLLDRLLVFGGHILMGVVIIGLGLFLANIVAKAVQDSDSKNAGLMSTIVRVVILVLAGAMALRQMEIANDIVNLAFGLLIGAVAVAVAIAFGLGGRDSAARLIEEWRGSAHVSRK